MSFRFDVRIEEKKLQTVIKLSLEKCINSVHVEYDFIVITCSTHCVNKKNLRAQKIIIAITILWG